MWTSLITAVPSIVVQWLENRKEKAQATHKKELQIIENTQSWEEIQAANSKDSWKDEWWTVVLSIPLILVFFPSYAPIIHEGFNQLKQTPDWYVGFVSVAVLTSFGIKPAVKALVGKQK